MIYITQLIFVKEGQEAVFYEFEDHVMPLIGRYNGILVLRLRPQPPCIIEHTGEVPHELHLVSFASEADFQAYLRDGDRQRFLHLKERSIRSSVFIKGTAG